MKRALLVLASPPRPSPASAPPRRAPERECEGLIVCIPVKGPWVQVPGGGTPTYYQLSCPGRGQIIGGLDADRAGPLELSFLGTARRPGRPRRDDEPVGRLRREDDALAGELPAAARLHPHQRRRRARAHVVQAEAEADGGRAGSWTRRSAASRTSA